MGAYNEELVKAGVMLAGEGLLPSSKGARVRFDKDGSATVVDGPFAETKELVAGFWILEVSSREEVLEWVKKAPFRDGEVEVRQVATAEDFGDAMTPSCASRRTGCGPPRGPAARGVMPAAPAPDGVDDGPAPRRRRRLAHGVREAHRVRSPASPGTSAWPRSWRRTRWSRRSSGGRRPASPPSRAPGSWPPPSTGPSTSSAARSGCERKTALLGRELERGRGAGLGGGARRGRRGRRPAAGLHLLPPGALPRGAGRADPPADRRPHDRGDRAGLPRRRSRRVAQRIVRAKRTLTAARVPFEMPAGRGVHRPARLGPRGRLPGLQRGLLGDGGGGLGAAGPLPGGAAAGPDPRRADAGGAGGARPGRAHGDPGLAAAARG